MPKLEEDPAPGLVDRLGNETPARHLLLGVDPGRIGDSGPLLGDDGRFGNDQAA
jgi:hypothetical protein